MELPRLTGDYPGRLSVLHYCGWCVEFSDGADEDS